MSCATPLILWSRLLAVVFLIAGPVLHADNPTPTLTEKKVPLKSGKKGDYIVVRDLPDVSDKDTGSSNHSSGFSGVSAMANKTFSPAGFSTAKEDPSLDAHGQNTFQVKSFDASAQTGHAVPKTDTAFPLPSARTYGHATTDLEKSYSTKHYETGTDKLAPSLASTTASDQDRMANLGDHQTETFDSPLPKQYLGPGAQNAPPGTKIKENVTLYSLNELPTRPLTIDEVRNLINHGFKPDTNKPPPPESKPLDDPDYKPEPRPAASEPIIDDDKNDPVPAPGTIAHPPPEDSEPLPQH